MAIRHISKADTQDRADNLPWSVPMEEWPTDYLRECITKVDEDFFPSLVGRARALLHRR